MQQDMTPRVSQEEEKSNENTMRYDPDWQSRGCRKHGPTEQLYLCRYEACPNIGEFPIYCDRCIGNDHPHKNHYPADEAGVRAYYRDINNPKNAEKYAEMSEVSVDSKGKCRWEREAEDEYSYYAEVFGQDVFHMQKLEHPISEEDQ